VGRDVRNGAVANGCVRPDDAQNDAEQIADARAVRATCEDDQVARTQPDTERSDDDQVANAQTEGAESSDGQVAITHADEEEGDDDRVAPRIVTVVKHSDTSSQDFDAYLMDPGTGDQFYKIRMMVWVGYMTSCNVPARRKGAPEPCLAHRRSSKTSRTTTGR
jgi:hypothetical protein